MGLSNVHWLDKQMTSLLISLFGKSHNPCLHMLLMVHSVSLSFRLLLSLSVNGQMAIQPYTSHSNYHLAIDTDINIFILKCLAKLPFDHFQ